MKGSNSNPYFFLLKTAWKYAYNERRKYVLIYLFFMLSNLVSSLYPVIWGIFINDLQQNGADILKHTWIYVSLFLSVRLGDWLFHGPSRIVERNLAFNIGRNFLAELYHKSLRLPVKWHQDHHSGATINRVRKAHEALRSFFDRGFEYLHTLFKFLFSFAAMIYFSPLFGGVAVILGAVVVWIILKFDKPYIKTLNEVNEGEHVVSSTLFDSLSNVITVITLRLQDRLEKTLLVRIQAIFPSFRKNTLINEWKWFVTDMMVGVIYAVIVVGYVWQNWKPGELFLMGGLVTLIGYVDRFTSVFHNIAYLYTDVVRYATDVKTAMVIPEAYEAQHLPEKAEPLPAGWQNILIQDLNFSHEKEFIHQIENPAISFHSGLSDIRLSLEKGKRIALIGESGSGKSTLLALLRGLYPPLPGEKVIVDGVESAQGLSLIADHVTLFPQDPEIFENTIEYNITLGLPYEKSEIDRITRMVHFDEVLQQLPKGLESNIVEKGVNLSGGQKQRLALARGLFAARDSEILLLDEPTSSVDPKTELKIYEQIFEACGDKVIISSLHRLHLLKYFHVIYVMDKGKIIASGNLTELLQRSEVFRELAKHQELKG
jgi:ATP-binding cassette subfamily B protein